MGLTVIIFTLIVPLYSLSSQGWLLITGAAFSAVGLMLVSASIRAHAPRLGEAIYVATPGGLLAVVGFTVAQYLQPINYSQYSELAWVGVAVLGLLWIAIGPIFAYGLKARLSGETSRADISEANSEQSNIENRSTASLTVATWLLVFVTIASAVITLLSIKH